MIGNEVGRKYALVIDNADHHIACKQPVVINVERVRAIAGNIALAVRVSLSQHCIGYIKRRVSLAICRLPSNHCAEGEQFIANLLQRRICR